MSSSTPIDEATESEDADQNEAEPSIDSLEGRYPITCLMEHYKPLEMPPDAAGNRKKLQRSLDSISN